PHIIAGPRRDQRQRRPPASCPDNRNLHRIADYRLRTADSWESESISSIRTPQSAVRNPSVCRAELILRAVQQPANIVSVFENNQCHVSADRDDHLRQERTRENQPVPE